MELEERSSKALFKFKFKMQFWQNLREKAPKILPEREFSKLFAFFFLGF